jgi:uncharacterized BrkB/YihY/UPF0761 family membrane protein
MADERRPPPTGRLARWSERANGLVEQVEAARSRHSQVDLGFELVERDATIAGGLLAGALAYRLFVLLLPTTLLLVSGLGLYAGAADKSPREVAQDAGLHGLIASQVAATASGRARGIVFVLMTPVVLYAAVTLYRSIAKVHALAWWGSGRGVRVPSRGVAVFLGAFFVQFLAAWILGWVRRSDALAGLIGVPVYVALVGGVWLVVSMQLPHGRVRWPALVPGSILFGIGLLGVNVFNVYVTTRIVEGRANTYGALGIATALLLSLVLVGRVIVTSAELNALLDERRVERRRTSTT